MSRVRLANAFPLPFVIGQVGPDDVGLDTPYPLGFSLDDLIKLYWRVRTWNFTGAVFDEDGNPSSATVSSTLLLPSGVACTDEPQVIGSAGLLIVAAGSGSIQENVMTIAFMFAGGGAACVTTGGLYYPSIIGGDGGGAGVANDFPFTFNGTVCGDPEGAAKRVLTIGDYWPYSGADGVALYDTTTGDPATNPATGAAFTVGEIVGAAYP